MAKPNKNAEHIRNLSLLTETCYGCYADALTAAIRALRNKGKSPWRKVTKRHPGKNWGGEQVIVALDDGNKTIHLSNVPYLSQWELGWFFEGNDAYRVTHWQPWPEHPEKEVK